jgi:hypothetical protein
MQVYNFSRLTSESGHWCLVEVHRNRSDYFLKKKIQKFSRNSKSIDKILDCNFTFTSLSTVFCLLSRTSDFDFDLSKELIQRIPEFGEYLVLSLLDLYSQ